MFFVRRPDRLAVTIDSEVAPSFASHERRNTTDQLKASYSSANHCCVVLQIVFTSVRRKVAPITDESVRAPDFASQARTTSSQAMTSGDGPTHNSVF